jgi:hypothetical protein
MAESQEARRIAERKLHVVNSAGFIAWAMADGEAKSDWIIARYQARVLVSWLLKLLSEQDELREAASELLRVMGAQVSTSAEWANARQRLNILLVQAAPVEAATDEGERDIPREAAALDAASTDDSQNEPPDFDVKDGTDV